MTNIINNIKCPNCYSSTYRKKGKRKGVQQFLCLNCNKYFKESYKRKDDEDYWIDCPKCGNNFYSKTKDNHTVKFCSKKCANSRQHTKETKIKIARSINAKIPKENNRFLKIKYFLKTINNDAYLLTAKPPFIQNRRIKIKFKKQNILTKKSTFNIFNFVTKIDNKNPLTPPKYIEKISIKRNKDKKLFINHIKKFFKTCPECKKLFQLQNNKQKKYCSELCLKKNIGGYREKSGRAKAGYYKGIYCGSTYELIWVIYNLDHEIPFERFPFKLSLNNISYIPDFYQNNKIIEIKGYETEKVKLKTSIANALGYDVILLKKEDLQKEFEWVKIHYKYKSLEELYDDYKPKFTYICSFCKETFFRNKKSKTTIVFCSRFCAGKGNKGNNLLGINQYTKN